MTGSCVRCLVLQPDGKLLVGGSLAALGAQPQLGLGRLNADGSPDLSFNPGLDGPSASVYCLLLQADGRIVVGGWFNSLGGLARSNLGRLNADGTVDLTFNPGPTAPLWTGDYYCLALQADGKILVGGDARLNNPTPATQSLEVDGTGITWRRGGTAPEFWRVTFESSLGGSDWVRLGVGTRLEGGWRLAGADLLPNARVRARGYVTGGIGNRSSWFIESIVPVGQPRPVIVTNDGSLGFRAGAFGFNVAALPGQTIVIQSSPDLVHWVPVATNSVVNPPFYYGEAEAGTTVQRFYRAIVP